MQAWNVLKNLSPSRVDPKSPARVLAAPCQKFHSKSSTCIMTQKLKMHNGKLAESTKFHLQHEKYVQENDSRCDLYLKQMLRTWMKTLLHCGFG